MNQIFARELHLPPPGRPNWRPHKQTDFDLLYLAWGRREYGKAPISISLHDGWTYLMVISGNPILRLVEQQASIHPGQVFLFGPNCAYGLADRPNASCEILSWIWKHPPVWNKNFTDSSNQRIVMTSEQLKRLHRIHVHCREETQLPDEFSHQVLAGLRCELDALLARGASGKPTPHTGEWRLHLALEWLQKQIGASDPARSLCDYLQVSASTLNRLFHDRLGTSPKVYIHNAKMEYALKLKKNHQLKEIAYLLGYKHANDLSRALANYKRRKYGGSA